MNRPGDAVDIARAALFPEAIPSYPPVSPLDVNGGMLIHQASSNEMKMTESQKSPRRRGASAATPCKWGSSGQGYIGCAWAMPISGNRVRHA